MIRKCFLAIMSLLIVAMAESGQGAVEKPKLVYSAGLGFCSPRGTLGEGYVSGMAFGGTIGVAISRSILEFRLDVGMDQVRIPGVAFGVPRRSGDLRAYGGALQMLIKFVTTGRVFPYVVGGVGPYRIKSDEWDSYSGAMSISRNRTGITLGLGNKILWKRFGIFFEYRFIELGDSLSMSRFWFGFVNR